MAVFERDEITVDGVPLIPRGSNIYIMLNKPRGFVTTRRDERGRKTVMSLVEDAGVSVFPVGRLDINSEGLLILTNDGGFAYAIAHPSRGKLKTYEVHVRGEAAKAVNMLRDPLTIDSHIVQASAVKLLDCFKDGGILSVSIYEGRNRQIRKMCACCGLGVISLKRVSIGMLELGSLKLGEWRYLTEEELKLLNDS